jgi:hypothetical protein
MPPTTNAAPATVAEPRRNERLPIVCVMRASLCCSVSLLQMEKSSVTAKPTFVDGDETREGDGEPMPRIGRVKRAGEQT